MARRQYSGDLSGIAHYMQDRAPELGDPTLMALGELLMVIAVDYEPDGESDSHLVREAYRVATAWLLNQDRA